MSTEKTPNSRITISEEKLDAALARTELRLVREIQEVRALVPSEDRIRQIIHEEEVIENQGNWKTRSLMAAVGMFLVSASSFLITLFHAPPSS